VEAAGLIPIEGIVTGLAGDSKLAAQNRHRLPGEAARDKLQAFIRGS
jgi:hypothetical protein